MKNIPEKKEEIFVNDKIEKYEQNNENNIIQNIT